MSFLKAFWFTLLHLFIFLIMVHLVNLMEYRPIPYSSMDTYIIYTAVAVNICFILYYLNRIVQLITEYYEQPDLEG